jgi:hypothetical protein
MKCINMKFINIKFIYLIDMMPDKYKFITLYILLLII